jgi:glucose-1-phosphate thymidylyltransferase
MKGIILCGGMGTRLRPLTSVLNKHLLPIYSKPMILYPLSTLKGMGITDILIISGGEHIGSFLEFLGDGSEYGVRFTYKVQKESGGIAQALSLAEDFVDERFAVILGDNIFEYPVEAPSACGLVLKEVENPNRFGVYHEGTIIEKPQTPLSKQAVTGLYFYTPEIFDFIKKLKPSARGELEITDVNNWCLENLETKLITYDGFWSDAGTFDSLLLAGNWAKEREEKDKK